MNQSVQFSKPKANHLPLTSTIYSTFFNARALSLYTQNSFLFFYSITFDKSEKFNKKQREIKKEREREKKEVMGGIRKRKGIIVLVWGSWVYYIRCMNSVLGTLFVPLSSHHVQSKQENHHFNTSNYYSSITSSSGIVLVLVLFFECSCSINCILLSVFYKIFTAHLCQTRFFCSVLIINRLSRERNNSAFYTLRCVFIFWFLDRERGRRNFPFCFCKP